MNGRPGPRRALDLAMGEGRHAIPLVEAGFVTYGVDVAVERLQNARRLLLEAPARSNAVGRRPGHLPASRGAFRPAVLHALPAAGALERPEAQRAPGRLRHVRDVHDRPDRTRLGPSSPDHLLEPGELGAAFADWTVMHSEEVDEPASLARLVARKPGA